VKIKVTFASCEDVEISNAEKLKEFAQSVNEGDGYEGTTVKLTDNIKLTGEWTYKRI
jgi:hypothetical protein